MNIKKILLPVDIPIASLDVIHQAAILARHFHSEIVMMHVVTAGSHAAGVPEDRDELAASDLLAVAIGEAQKQQDQSLGPDLAGLIIRCRVVKSDPAVAILQMAEAEKADLIMMPPHGNTFEQFLLGSVAAKVLHGSDCPVWTSAYVEESEPPSEADNPMFLYGGVGMGETHLVESTDPELKQLPAQEFAIHSVLCAVDFGPRSHKAISWATQMAAEFAARITLVHVTASVEFWGPGGTYVNPKWKEELVSGASQYLAALQKAMGTKADILIGSGDVPKTLSQAAKQTKADLLISGCYPYGGNLRIHGYAIICAVQIPVLNV